MNICFVEPFLDSFFTVGDPTISKVCSFSTTSYPRDFGFTAPTLEF